MPERIKVVFSIGGLHGGGSERQMVSLLKHISRERIKPFLYLMYRTGPLQSEVPDDVPVVAFDERYRGSRWPGLLMHRRHVRDMSRYLVETGADVCYDRTFLMTLIAAKAAQRLNVPNVSTIVTDPPMGFGAVAGRFQRIKRRILRRLYSNSTKVVANSEGAARSAERFYGLRKGLVGIHYNGVDLSRIRSIAGQEPDEPWWTATSEAQSTFRIVTAGRLNEKKGFHLLVEAVRQLRQLLPQVDIQLAILGEGPGREQLSYQIGKDGLENCVRLTGFRTDAVAWYKSADLFVLPSFLEGMPNVLLEAMACGTPVLSTDCPSGPREILADGEFGELCKVGSSEALVEAIRRFVTDDEYGQRYTLKAKRRVEEEFSIQNAAAKLEDILLEASMARS